MIDSIFNLIIVLIPISIFIGRAIVQARNRRAPPPPAQHIPVHFEDYDEEETSAYERMRQLATHEMVAAPPKASPVTQALHSKAALFNNAALPSAVREQQQRTKKPPVTVAPGGPSQGIGFNLNHLSQLQQAVVMAEVLGPPKALQ